MASISAPLPMSSSRPEAPEVAARRPRFGSRRGTAVRPVLAALALQAALAGTAGAEVPDRLSEVYGSWTVSCVAADTGRTCVMTQALTAADSTNRVLQAELQIVDGATRLVLLAPFGALLEAGIVASVDGTELRRLPYRTCLPAGCVVWAELTADELAAVRRGALLRLVLKAADTGADVNLDLSLAGVSAAHNRLGELSR